MARLGRGQPNGLRQPKVRLVATGASVIPGVIASQSTVVAGVKTPAIVAVTVASQSTVVAGVSVRVLIVPATIASNSTVVGAVTVIVPITPAVIASQSSVIASVVAPPAVRATIASQSGVVASVTTPANVSATIASNSTVVVNAGVLHTVFISALIQSISTVEALVETPAPTPPTVSPSPRFLSTALAADQTAITLVQVWSEPTATMAAAFVADITKYCTPTGLTWGENETQTPRRTGSLTLESQGLLKDGLIPKKIGDLLHPLSGNEIRIYQGYTWSDGTSETYPCGVYRISKPTTTDNDKQAEIVITLNDRAAEVTRRSWTVPYVISGAPTIDAAIAAGIATVWPGLTLNLEPSTYTVPDVTFGTQGMTSPQDPMADFIGMATDNGQELFFDENGVLVLRTIPDPTTVAIALVFEEGPFCTVDEVAEEQDETEAYNTVVVTSSAPGVEFPIQITVSITDPDNPFNPTNYGAVVPYFYTSPLILTDDQATAAGLAQLLMLMSAYDLVSFSAVMNASAKCGLGIQLVRARLGINETFCITETSFSSDVSQEMQLTLRSRVSPDGS